MQNHAASRRVRRNALFVNSPLLPIRFKRTHLTAIEPLALDAQRHYRVRAVKRLSK